jgi:hypothetical protein
LDTIGCALPGILQAAQPMFVACCWIQLVELLGEHVAMLESDKRNSADTARFLHGGALVQQQATAG